MDRAEQILVGVLAGGAGSRMGGIDKALLPVPGYPTVLARLQAVAAEAQLPLVVVGGPERPGLSVVSDAPTGIGPLGGLRALLIHAGHRPTVVVGCDMPYVTASLLERLARTPTTAAIVAPRDPATGKWNPLFARYDSARVRASLDAALAAGTRSFQPWFGLRGEPPRFGLGEVQELGLSAEERELLRDWDEPADITRGSG